MNFSWHRFAAVLFVVHSGRVDAGVDFSQVDLFWPIVFGLALLVLAITVVVSCIWGLVKLCRKHRSLTPVLQAPSIKRIYFG